MRFIRFSPGIVAILLGAMAVFGTCASGADISAAIGDRVNLSGSAIGTDSIYLFVTGPGLASNGVRPDNMRTEVVTGDPSTFTVTDVTNDRWAYSWNTARQGFTLKEGIYTVYAVKQPVGKNDLSGSTYGAMDVSLTYSGEPYVSTGTVFVATAPVPAMVYVDGQLKGVSPLSLTLPIGTHSIRLEHEGYQPITGEVPVAGGAVIEVRKEFIPPAGTLAPGTTVATPAPASVQETRPATVPPTTKAGGPAVATLPAFLIGLIGMRRLRHQSRSSVR